MYLYELPTTGAISFADFCIDHSSDKVYTHYIPETSQARANLRGALKVSKRIEYGEKDFLSVVKVQRSYIVIFKTDIGTRQSRNTFPIFKPP